MPASLLSRHHYPQSYPHVLCLPCLMCLLCICTLHSPMHHFMISLCLSLHPARSLIICHLHDTVVHLFPMFSDVQHVMFLVQSSSCQRASFRCCRQLTRCGTLPPQQPPSPHFPSW